jgi:hypothetical protein
MWDRRIKMFSAFSEQITSNILNEKASFFGVVGGKRPWFARIKRQNGKNNLYAPRLRCQDGKRRETDAVSQGLRQRF